MPHPCQHHNIPFPGKSGYEDIPKKLSRVNQALIVSLSRFPCQEIRCGQINRIDAIFGCQNIGGQVPIPNVAVQLNQRTQRIIKWVKLGAGAIDIDSIQADPFHLVKILSYRISEIVIAHQGKFHGYFLPKITAYGLGGGSAQGQPPPKSIRGIKITGLHLPTGTLLRHPRRP